MDGATTRIWLDDPNPIFRKGLAASLRDSRFVVVGESVGMVPPPPLDGIDVLVFDLGEPSHDWSLSRRRRRSTRLVGLVPGGDVEAAHESQCTVLARSDLTPEGFRDCLASVVAGAAPPATGSRTDGARRFGTGRVAWADTGRRLRRVVSRKGALFAVVVALGAGVFGPTGKADGLGAPDGAAAVAVPASAETAPVQSAEDAADDVAVWINQADPVASLVIGTDRRGAALEIYDLKGQRVQRLARPPGTTNNVDIRPGFSLGNRTVALVGTAGKGMSFYRLDPAGRRLVDVGARRWTNPGVDAGFCLYRSGVTGRFYAFVTEPDGDITQYELFDQGGFVDARAVRGWPLGSAAAGCVADDEGGRLFVSEKSSGIWRYNAEPDGTPLARTQVDKAGSGHLAAEVEGLALVLQPGHRGFLLASSEGDSSFAIYRRGRDHAWLGQREVVAGRAADGCSDTDGIEAVAADLGPDFPAGIFICQDGRNTAPGSAGRQNFKYVRLDQLLDASRFPA